MHKPQTQCEVATSWFSVEHRCITFSATPDAASVMAEFGKMSKEMFSGDDDYRLWVDPRYDFLEVLKYINEYGKDKGTTHDHP